VLRVGVAEKRAQQIVDRRGIEPDNFGSARAREMLLAEFFANRIEISARGLSGRARRIEFRGQRIFAAQTIDRDRFPGEGRSTSAHKFPTATSALR